MVCPVDSAGKLQQCRVVHLLCERARRVEMCVVSGSMRCVCVATAGPRCTIPKETQCVCVYLGIQKGGAGDRLIDQFSAQGDRIPRAVAADGSRRPAIWGRQSRGDMWVFLVDRAGGRGRDRERARETEEGVEPVVGLVPVPPCCIAAVRPLLSHLASSALSALSPLQPFISPMLARSRPCWAAGWKWVSSRAGVCAILDVAA